MADPRSDAALLAGARAGDDHAFGVLVARHARTAYLVALGVVGDADLAEDVCQDALFRAWRRLGECRDGARFGGWLLQVVRRHALNALRGRKSAVAVEAQDLAAPAPSPARLAEHADLAARLDAALARLPREQREAVLLFDLENRPHAEIAELLETSEAMSRQHLMLGRRALRGLLGQEELP